MSDITRWKVSGPTTRLQPDTNGPWVALVDYYRVIDRLIAERDEARGEVERVKQERDDHRAEFERLVVERDDHRFQVERLTEQVGALTVAVEQADEAKADAEAAAAAEEAETDQVTCERDVAQAEVQRLMRELGERSATNQRLMAERDAAQAEVERLKRMLPPTTHTGLRNGPGEGSWSVFAGTVVEERDAAQAEVERLTVERDEAQAERDAAQRERERVQDLLTLAGRELSTLREALRQPRRDQSAKRDAAQAEVERLTVERDEAREKLARVQMQYIDDEFAKVTAKVINRHQRECDHACQQVDRLQQTGADRPTDEDIWREAFMSQLHDRYWAASEVADVALAEYRKRWPR